MLLGFYMLHFKGAIEKLENLKGGNLTNPWVRGISSIPGEFSPLPSLLRLFFSLPLFIYNITLNWVAEKPQISQVVVQFLSHVWLFATLWTAACQASLSFTISWSLLRLMSIESMMPSNHLILCRPLLLLPSNFPSIRVLSNESANHSIHISVNYFLK